MDTRLDLKTVLDRIRRNLSGSITPKQMGVLGRFVVEQIKERSRKGYGTEGGAEKKFPALSDEYIKQRQRDKRLSPFTSARKSNITRTGRLLASLRYTTNTGRSVIKPTGSRPKSDWTNEELAEHLQNNMDRPFLSLSQKQIRALLKFFEANVFKLK
jgi:hypothetical protein